MELLFNKAEVLAFRELLGNGRKGAAAPKETKILREEVTNRPTDFGDITLFIEIVSLFISHTTQHDVSETVFGVTLGHEMLPTLSRHGIHSLSPSSSDGTSTRICRRRPLPFFLAFFSLE